jgi:hypothetical protein
MIHLSYYWTIENDGNYSDFRKIKTAVRRGKGTNIY